MTRKDLPSRLAGCVKYAKNKNTVSAKSGNITFMLANKTFFFSQWTHNLFVQRKRAKWKMTSQWAFYDAARAERVCSFPGLFLESVQCACFSEIILFLWKENILTCLGSWLIWSKVVETYCFFSLLFFHTIMLTFFANKIGLLSLKPKIRLLR